MTARELSQIHYINGEIRMWQRELNRLECRSLAKGQEITDMPYSPGRGDRVADLAAEIADIKAVIDGKLAEIQIQRKKILDYIASIDDSLIRQIFFYRHVSCMGWNQVADNIGGDNTAEGVRKKHYRFLNK